MKTVKTTNNNLQNTTQKTPEGLAVPVSVAIHDMKTQWPEKKGQTTIYKTLCRKLEIEQHGG